MAGGGVTMRKASATLAGAISLAAASLCATDLLANDTMAGGGVGGLQFEQTDKIRMEREDLYLSPREVRVSYVFRNLTTQDVRGRVAFPMPGEIWVYHVSFPCQSGLGPSLSAGSLDIHDRRTRTSCTGSVPFGQACQHLWLVGRHDVYQDFAYAVHTTQS